jgi:hypothetical protein
MSLLRTAHERAVALATVAAVGAAGFAPACGGTVDCRTEQCVADDGDTSGGRDAASGSAAGGAGHQTGGAGGATSTSSGNAGAPPSGPAIQYPYEPGFEPLEWLRASSEILSCADANQYTEIGDCDWWSVSIGIPAADFSPGVFEVGVNVAPDIMISMEAAAGPSCLIKTGGGLGDADSATLTILEVTATTATFSLTGVDLEPLNYHDVNGTYSAIRCAAP